jgi:hypothetical protein
MGRKILGARRKITRAAWKTLGAGAMIGGFIGTPLAFGGMAVGSFANQRYGMKISGVSADYDPNEGVFMPSGPAGGGPHPTIMHARASAMGGGRDYKMGADGSLALALHHRRRG